MEMEILEDLLKNMIQIRSFAEDLFNDIKPGKITNCGILANRITQI